MDDITKILKLDESDTLEFKKSTSQLESALKSVCAFLNHQGGVVYFGITPDRRSVGQDVSDQTLRSISQKIRQRIKPEIIPDIKVLDDKEKKIIKVMVHKGDGHLYYLDGIPYKRVGTENVIIPPDEIEKILLEKRRFTWDEQTCEESNLDDLDLMFVEKEFVPLYETIVKEKIAGHPRDLLQASGCIKDDKPTNAGVVLFGKEPQKFFLNTYIALARYRGVVESGERLDFREFTGNLFRQVDNCYEYILEHMALMSRLQPGKIRREDIPEYGRFTIRELVTNAVCHRDYENQHTKIIIKMFDDRIEFYNPGGLAKGITPENITEKQYSRNPIIAKVLAKVKYIEELGEGWDKIIKEHETHPLQPEYPQIISDGFTTVIKIFSTQKKFEETEATILLNERQKKALEYIKIRGRITNQEYRNKFNIVKDTAGRDLKELVEKKLIVQKGAGRSVHYVLK